MTTGVRPVDAYRVLGLHDGADEREIRLAYRRLAREYHPDRYAMSQVEIREQAEQRMAEINIAFAVLTDPEAARRQEHSEIRRDAAIKKRRGATAASDQGTVFATSATTPGRPSTPPPASRPATSTSAEDFDYRKGASSEFDVDVDKTPSDGGLFTMQKKPKGGRFRRK